jgi:hypothetical protein
MIAHPEDAELVARLEDKAFDFALDQNEPNLRGLRAMRRAILRRLAELRERAA